MSLLKRFARYAEAFETTFDDDNWSRLKEYFTEDAVYESKPPFEARAAGVDAVLEHFRGSVNAFDRRFAERRLMPKRPPTESADTVTMAWEATYEASGAPDLKLSGTEVAHFRGDRMCRLEDEFDAGVGESVAAWMAAHAAKLKPL